MSQVPNRTLNVITAAGAVTPGSEYNQINATGALALTIASAPVDGQIMSFVDETGHAHTIVCTGLNGGTTLNKLTFGAAIGDSCQLIARNGFWWTLNLNGVTVS